MFWSALAKPEAIIVFISSAVEHFRSWLLPKHWSYTNPNSQAMKLEV